MSLQYHRKRRNPRQITCCALYIGVVSPLQRCPIILGTLLILSIVFFRRSPLRLLALSLLRLLRLLRPRTRLSSSSSPVTACLQILGTLLLLQIHSPSTASDYTSGQYRSFSGSSGCFLHNLTADYILARYMGYDSRVFGRRTGRFIARSGDGTQPSFHHLIHGGWPSITARGPPDGVGGQGCNLG